MEPAIRADVRATLAAGVRAGGFDAAQTLAWAIPVRTVSRLLGLPVDDEPTLRDWLHAVIRRAPDQDRLPPAARAAGDDLRSYFAEHVERRRRIAGDDLLADVVAAEGRGELTGDETPGLCILLYVAGTETVADLIGNALAVLAEHPDQRAALAANPALGPAAVEELVRFESPVQYQVRTATAATELHSVTIPAGSAVALLWGAANRDERRWERPDELDLTRQSWSASRRTTRAEWPGCRSCRHDRVTRRGPPLTLTEQSIE
jgi:cytochrome P450